LQTYQKILLKIVRPVSSRITSQCTFKVTWTFRGPFKLFVLPRSISCADRKQPKFVQNRDFPELLFNGWRTILLCLLWITMSDMLYWQVPESARYPKGCFLLFYSSSDFTMVLPGRDYLYCTAFKSNCNRYKISVDP
jgi:hypothetical protein